MQTDEFEISLSREIAICRKMVRRLQDSLAKREKGSTIPQSEPDWQRDVHELLYWEKMLREYEHALHSLRLT
jgi:hypothetical protein